jgi:hypothetical protein
MTPTARTPFEIGYQHGAATHTYASAAEAHDLYPTWTARMVELYLNGRDDGVAGDDWRLRQAGHHKGG